MQHDQNCSGYLPQAIIFNNYVVYKLLKFQCAKNKVKCEEKTIHTLKLFTKSKKEVLKPNIWSHNGWDFKYIYIHLASMGCETQFSPKFGVKMSYLFFSKCLQPITIAYVCRV